MVGAKRVVPGTRQVVDYLRGLTRLASLGHMSATGPYGASPRGAGGEHPKYPASSPPPPATVPVVAGGRPPESNGGPNGVSSDRPPSGYPFGAGQASKDPLLSRPPFDRSAAAVWFWLALGGFVGGYVVSYILLEVFASIAGQVKQLPQLESAQIAPWWVTIGALVGLWIGFFAALVIASKTRGTGSMVSDFGLKVRLTDIPFGIVVGVVGQVVIDLAYVPFEHLYPSLQKSIGEPANRLTGGFNGADLWVIGILTVAVVPVIEELFFRGLLMQSLIKLSRPAGRVLGPALGIVLTGILFGLAHAELANLAGLAVFGMILCLLAYKTGRIGPSIFAHAGFNLFAVIAIALQR